MSDFGTMRQQVADNLGITLDAAVLDAQVGLAIVAAIRKHRHRPFPWNVADLSITPLPAETFEIPKGANPYELPTDFLFLHGQDLWLEDTSATAFKAYAMAPITSAEWEEERRMASDNYGTPKLFNFKGTTLRIVPAPETGSAYTIYGQYYKDLGEPTRVNTSGVWSFTEGDSFTNAWFSLADGYELIQLSATQHLAEGYLKEPDIARMWAELYASELAGRVIEEERIRSSRQVQAWY